MKRDMRQGWGGLIIIRANVAVLAFDDTLLKF